MCNFWLQGIANSGGINVVEKKFFRFLEIPSELLLNDANK